MSMLPCSRQIRGVGLEDTGMSPMEEYVMAEARQDGVAMAKAFLKTCPHDWCSGWGIRVQGALRRLIEGKKPDEVNPIAMMKFRWEVAQDVDDLITRFGLPVPEQECCLMWDSYCSKEEGRSPNYGRNYHSAFDFIRDSPMAPMPPSDLHGYHFHRPTPYLATAVALADHSSEKQEKLLNTMSELVLEWQKARVERLIVQVAGKKRSSSRMS